MNMILWFLDFAKQNPVVAAGISIWGAATLTLLVNRLPSRILSFLKKQLTVALEIRSGESDIYDPFLAWFESQKFSKRIRVLQIQRNRYDPFVDGRPKSADASPNLILSLGTGHHYFMRGWRIFQVKRETEPSAVGTWGSIIERVTVTCLGRSQQPIRDLISEVKQLAEQSGKNFTSIYAWSNGWTLFSCQLPRKLDSIFIEPDKMKLILETIHKFLDSKEYYLDRGIPYRLGILFYGMPGSGKTSMVNALAHNFGRQIRTLDISNVSNNELMAALANEVKSSLFLIEDIDSFREVAEDDSQTPSRPSGVTQGISVRLNRLTLSGLLCALDGASASDGRVVIMTTNHIKNLPAALMRKGRVDLAVEFAPIGRDEAIRMMKYLYWSEYGVVSETIFKDFRIKNNISAAELQGLILANRSNPEAVMKAIQLCANV
jgi:chaperone BCS1